jgi:hypothetical protein
MSKDAKIYVDMTEPATLYNGPIATDFCALRDAIMAWHRLRADQARTAKIKVIGGAVYTASEIPKLHYNPKSTSR